MKRLAKHYDRIRKRYPEAELLVLFDIDGTILDMRCMIQYVLKAYDPEHGTEFFEQLEVGDVTVHENQVESLLEALNIPWVRRQGILDWYLEHRWTPDAIFQSHHPFAGVMEVIRWFQIQPRTRVGLNTGRPETLRADTLRSLNELGKEYRVHFADELLFMNAADWERDVQNSKARGVEHFRKAGFRVIAMVDNEPDNLTAVAEVDPEGEILLLHADTIFETKRSKLPAGAAKGRLYDITELIPEKALPQHIQFVWHGLNDEANIRQFLASNIHWAEFDVRTGPEGSGLILRHDSLKKTPLHDDEELLPLEEILTRVERFEKAVKLDLKEGGEMVDCAIELIQNREYDLGKLWFNGNVEVLKEEGIRKLADALPEVIVQVPIDFLVPLIAVLPEQGKVMLETLKSWGVNRFSISWKEPQLTELMNLMDTWGFPVNLYAVPDLESFLRAVLLQPRSITSDFNFPQWHYYGRGSGEDAHRHEYSLRSR
ncbi:MAG: hypothetical protein GTN78_12235 [Gemmatimonadales bacterium]|nr:hypothetical protein [Gemmatimonadales bacterium]